MAIHSRPTRAVGSHGQGRRPRPSRTYRPLPLVAGIGMIESRAMFCPKCGKQNDDRALFCQHCGIGFDAKKPSPSSVVATAPYAGFWMRFLAWLIDWIIISTVSGLIAAATFGAGIVVFLVGPWLYEAFMLSSEWQATVGKRALSIVVT